ncbi:MAG: hypothetical protein ACXV3D_07895 [Halobacteriota archaeon]
MEHVETYINTMLGKGDVDMETDDVISEKQRRSKIIRGIVLELDSRHRTRTRKRTERRERR